MPPAIKKLRHPHLDPAHRKRHRRHSQRRSQECRIAKQPKNTRPLRSLFRSRVRIKLSPLRFFQKRNRNRQQKSRRRRNIKRKPPPIMRSQISPQQISRRRAHGDRQIKHAQNPPASFLRKKIGNKRRGEGQKRGSPTPPNGGPHHTR